QDLGAALTPCIPLSTARRGGCFVRRQTVGAGRSALACGRPLADEAGENGEGGDTGDVGWGWPRIAPAIEPDGAHAGSLGSGDVIGDAIADVEGVLRMDAEPGRGLEQAGWRGLAPFVGVEG